MPETFSIFVVNLEGVSSLSILSSIGGEIEGYNSTFVLFTNVDMRESHISKELVKILKKKGYSSDSYEALGPKYNLPSREILFHKKEVKLLSPVQNTYFDGTVMGFRAFSYSIPFGKETKKIIIKTFTLHTEVPQYQRKTQISHVLAGDLDLLVPEVVVSDFRILEWENYEQPQGWIDLYDFSGTQNEDSNYDGSRRDRIWIRSGSCTPSSLSSVEIPDPHNKLAGNKKFTLGVVQISS